MHGPGLDEPLVWYEGATTTTKNWLYADHLGSIVATADATGTSTAILSYGPYGEPNQTTGVRFRYTGQQLLGQLNLYYYKARFYSPAIGRFLQTDPIGTQDDLNLYAYVGNNPVNRIDPTGLFAGELSQAAGAFVAAAERNPAIAATLVAPVFAVPGAAPMLELQSYASGDVPLGKVNITSPYQRPSGATTPAQRASVQGQPCVDCGVVTPRQVADHKTPLVKEYYETGTIDTQKMRSVDAVQPQCSTCSAKQGADMSRYSREQREKLGL